jgi:hypothetical protein
MYLNALALLQQIPDRWRVSIVRAGSALHEHEPHRRSSYVNIDLVGIKVVRRAPVPYLYLCGMR